MDFFFSILRQLLVQRKNRSESLSITIGGNGSCLTFTVGEPFVRTEMALIVEPATDIALDHSRHAEAIVNASLFEREQPVDAGRVSVKGLRGKGAFFLSKGVVVWTRDDVHRREANYFQVVHVDYLDYDQEDYDRFGRWEKQLAS